MDAAEEAEPVDWVRRPATLSGNPGPYGRHGESTLFRWAGGTKSTWDLNTTTGTGDRVFLGHVTVPGWDNTAITV